MMLDNSTFEIAGAALPTAEDMETYASEATCLLKSMGHEGRLMILCHLHSGEKNVTQLKNLLSLSQATISQSLARMRAERLITVRRVGRTRLYTLKDPRACQMVEFVCQLYGKGDKAQH